MVEIHLEGEKVDKLKFGNVAFGILALVGLFLPIAAGGNASANIHHIGGLSLLLYAVPVLLLGVSILSIYKTEVKHLRIWQISLCVFGGVLLVNGTMQGMGLVNAFNQQVAAFEESQRQFDAEFKQRQESFQKAWNNFGKSAEQQQAVKQEEPKQEERQASIPGPTATPGVGAIFLGVGLVGSLVLVLL